MTSGQKLKELRERADISIRDMAEKIGWNYGRYNSRESRSKKPYLEFDLAEKIIPVLSERGIPEEDIMALVAPQDKQSAAAPSMPIKGRIVSGQPLASASRASAPYLDEDFLEDPAETIVVEMGDDSMVAALPGGTLGKGAIVYARPVWLPTEGQPPGIGGIFLFVNHAADGSPVWYVRELQESQFDQRLYAVAHALDAHAYPPLPLPGLPAYDSADATPAPDDTGTPHIYAVVEQILPRRR